ARNVRVADRLEVEGVQHLADSGDSSMLPQVTRVELALERPWRIKDPAKRKKRLAPAETGGPRTFDGSHAHLPLEECRRRTDRLDCDRRWGLAEEGGVRRAKERKRHPGWYREPGSLTSSLSP